MPLRAGDGDGWHDLLVAPGEMKSASQRLAEDYSATAWEYARLWGPVILPMGLPLLRALPLEACVRILDVGTGVGGFLPQLRDQAGQAFVCGVDRAEGMLRAARHEHRMPVGVMDAEELAFRGEVFDVAVLVFVLFHLPRPWEGLAEVARVLRREGWVGLTTWADDPGLPGQQIWSQELDRHGAGPDPRDPSVRQHGLVDRPEKVSRLLEAAGFGSIELWAERFERRWDYGSLIVVQRACGVPARRLASLSREKRAACVASVRARIRAIPESELVWRPEVLFAVARRSG